MNEFQFNDLLRRVAALITVGKIAEVDDDKARARVQVGDVLTDWRPWSVGMAALDRSWSAPEPGEQVILISPSGDLRQAIIIGSLYQTVYPAPASDKNIRRIEWQDGTFVEYNRSTKELKAHSEGKIVADAVGDIEAIAQGNINASASGSLTAEAGGTATLKAPSIVLDGNVLIKGNFSAEAGNGGNGGGAFAGDLNVTGHTHLESADVLGTTLAPGNDDF